MREVERDRSRVVADRQDEWLHSDRTEVPTAGVEPATRVIPRQEARVPRYRRGVRLRGGHLFFGAASNDPGPEKGNDA